MEIKTERRKGIMSVNTNSANYTQNYHDQIRL